MTTLAPPGSSRRQREYVYEEDLRDFVDYGERPRRRPQVAPPRAFTPGNPSRRIRSWQVISLVLLAIVAVRVIDLQAIQGPELAAAALRDATTTKELPAARGVISDRNGVPLALTVDAVNVTADQTEINPKFVTADARALASVLGGDPRGYEQRLSDDLSILTRESRPRCGRRFSH